MAINQNPSLNNENTLYLACSGGGKSQALKQNKQIPASKVRVLLWDPDNDHKSTRFECIEEYRKAVISGIKSGKGFRIAYSGSVTVDAFEQWCRIAWAVLDGRKMTYCIIEELADVSPSSAKATPAFGELLRRGRKYGARLHIVSQRGAEISKTVYTQCPIKFIGQQEGNDIKNMAIHAGVSPENIKVLRPLQFYRKVSGPDGGQLVTFKYKK